MIDRRQLLAGALAAGLAGRTRADTPPPAGEGALPAGLPQPSETLELWPDGAPGLPASPLLETVTERSTDPAVTDRAVQGITRPRLVVFRPRLPNGAAMLITPSALSTANSPLSSVGESATGRSSDAIGPAKFSACGSLDSAGGAIAASPAPNPPAITIAPSA